MRGVKLAGGEGCDYWLSNPSRSRRIKDTMPLESCEGACNLDTGVTVGVAALA